MTVASPQALQNARISANALQQFTPENTSVNGAAYSGNGGASSLGGFEYTGGDLGEGVRASAGASGWNFYNDTAGSQGFSTAGGDLYNAPQLSYYGATAIPADLIKSLNNRDITNLGAGLNFDPATLGFTNADLSNENSAALQNYLSQDVANIAAQGGGGTDRENYTRSITDLNKYLGAGGATANTENHAADLAYMKAQRDKGSYLSRFASFAAVPLGIATAGLAAPLAAGATGVAAGGAATGGLGSALGSFATNAAIKGAITGGLGGLASGGDLSSALKGAAFGGLGGGFGSALGGAAGLGNVGQQALTSGITGAAGGLGAGNVQDALTGGVLGGAGGYLKAGGEVPFFGSVDQQLPNDVFGPAKQGTGLLGGAQDLLQGSTGTGLTIGGQPMQLGSLLSAGGDIYGYQQGKKDLEGIQDIYSQAQQQASAQLDPYAQAGTQALGNLQGGYDAFTQDPSYQFQLDQGNQAVERSLAAQGLGQSGAALKAAQEYGQGLASQSYDNYFNQQSSLANQGYNAASGLGSILGQGAQGQAAAQTGLSNNRNQALSSLFGGGYDDDGDILQGSLGRLLGGFF